MKKQLVLGTATLAALVLLGACTSDAEKETATSSSAATSVSSTVDTAAEYQDGEYRAEAKEFSNDYKEYVVVTVADGKISDVEYNAFNADNELKTDNAGYKETMEEKNGTYPEKYMTELADSLKETQNPADVEVVTGATHSSENFKILAQTALDAAKEGNTDVQIVDFGE